MLLPHFKKKALCYHLYFYKEMYFVKNHQDLKWFYKLGGKVTLLTYLELCSEFTQYKLFPGITYRCEIINISLYISIKLFYSLLTYSE